MDPQVGNATYEFNNLMYDVQNGLVQMWNIGNSISSTLPIGQQYIFNNTVQANSGTVVQITGCAGTAFPTTWTNNHWIVDTTSIASSCTSNSQVSLVTNSQMTNAKATTNGYTVSRILPIRPPRVVLPQWGSEQTYIHTVQHWREAVMCSSLRLGLLAKPTPPMPATM